MAAADDKMAELAERTAVLKQRSDDQEEHIRTFGPLVSKQAVLEERVEGLQTGLNDNRTRTEVLAERQAAERLRVDGKFEAIEDEARERARNSRRDKWTKYTALIALLLTFGGLVIGMLTLLSSGAPH